MIKILYFASIKEQLKCSNEEVSLENKNTIKDLMSFLISRGDKWKNNLTSTNVQIAINKVKIRSLDDCIKNGDEVAFYPPVTGG
jgi:molybdopterin synthase sulfur carrier subunit